MRGPSPTPKAEVRIQPPAEPRALREAAESEAEPARGFTGAPAQGAAQTAPVEPRADAVVIDALDVAAVGEIVKLILETAGYVLGGLRPKLLRSIGQGIFKDADGMGDHIAPGAALTLAVKTQIPMQAIRWSSWVATPIRYGLAKAAPERFTPIPEKPARQMQPGGAEPPPRSPAPMPDPSATLEAPGLEVGSG